MRIMQRSKFTFYSSLTVTAVAALTLAGCASASPGSGADSVPQSEPQADQQVTAAQNGTAQLSVGEATYSAELQHCSLQGGEDALFHGVALDESGAEVGYLDGDFGGLTDVPHGEARLDFGATGQFQSADEFIALGDAMSNFVVTAADDTSLIIVGGAWDQDGTQLTSATLRVNC